jgi:hypothetical protein
LGSGIKAGQALGSFGELASKTTVLAKTAPGISATSSLGESAQVLGTALGTGDKWNTDKFIAVGEASAELAGKGAAAGAGYLIAGPAGAAKAVDAANDALAVGKWAGDKLTDTEVFKRATDRFFHTKTYEDQAAELDRQFRAHHASQQ